MKKEFISIIAPNIKSGGGKELLEYLIEYILETRPEIKLKVYLDISMSHISCNYNLEIVHLSSSFAKILLFYRKIDNSIYFGNLPPLRKSSNSMVYFHNPYLIMELNELRKKSLKFFIKYNLQQLYIKYFIKNVNTVACQNEEIKQSFINIYSFNNVKVLPFFRLCNFLSDKKIDKIYDFCYVSLAHPHKNHIKLIDAIKILSDKNISIKIALTIESGHDKLIEKIDDLNQRGIVNIVNLGVLSKGNVCKLYSESKALVFPSLQETFGLALIEAVKMNIDIIASDLDYVYNVVEPSLVFNPNDENDIANKLLIYMNENTIKSRSLIENKIQELVDTIVKREIK